MTIEEYAALNVHERALEEGKKYASQHGCSIEEEMAYGRGYKTGYMCGAKEFADKAVTWLRDRINIPYDVAADENGEPLADSYIDYAKKRLDTANEIIEEFKKYLMN